MDSVARAAGAGAEVVRPIQPLLLRNVYAKYNGSTPWRRVRRKKRNITLRNLEINAPQKDQGGKTSRKTKQGHNYDQEQAGKKRGKAVSVKYNLPIRFKLN